MRSTVVYLAISLLFIPAFVFSACSNQGGTVVYVNGILATYDQAYDDLHDLQRRFEDKFGFNSGIKFTNGYNPSHIAGFGDLIESASQSLGFPFSNYDLNTILLQIYPEITTRKILLVGHSQGTFYTNEIYDYLLSYGEQKETVGVYNVATPASFVAGDGIYLTSANDKVINAVRAAALKIGAKQPRPANIALPLSPEEAADQFGGHSFSGVYLANAAGRIVSEIESSFGKLTAGNLSDTRDAGCFTPPAKNFSYRVQQALFTAGDPLASGVVSAAKVTLGTERAVGDALANTMIAAAGGIKDAATLLLTLGQSAPQAVPSSSQANSPQVTSAPTSASALMYDDKKSNNTRAIAAPNNASPQASITDSVGGTPDVAFANNVPALTPDPAITNGGLPSGGGASVVYSAGSLGSISAPGAGAAPTNTVTANPANTNRPSPTTTSTSTLPSSQETSTSTPPSAPPPDTTPPDIAFALQECSAASLASDGCLLTNSAIHLSWSSAARDLAHFEITCEVNSSPCVGFSFAPTSATSTEFALAEENKAYTFKAKAIDKAGNISSEVTQAVTFLALPIVINEVAWMGTGSSATTSKDEWLELYNNTGYSVNLSGWTLSFFKPATTTPAHVIALAGIIPAKGFYLIERTNDTAVADIPADLVFSFGSGGLLNSGMIVKLYRGGTIIDRTPELCQIGFQITWCAGSNFSYDTMERIGPGLSGEASSNWATHSDLGANIKNGINADGDAINGTPKRRNSQSYIIAVGALSQNKTLTKENSPYIIQYPFTILAGATLTIPAGITVKMGGGAGILVQGRILSEGSASKPVVFTSIHDDTYAGDTNQNGTSTAPAPGDWRGIKIINPTEASQFDYTVFRYGGAGCGWACPPAEDRAMLSFVSSPVNIRHAAIEYPLAIGVYSLNSSGIIADSVFRDNRWFDIFALGIDGGSVTIQNNTFDGNRNGLSVFNGPHVVSGNVFTKNQTPVAFGSTNPAGTPTFSGNSASGNTVNGITAAAISNDYTFEKDLPYVGTISVAAGKTLNIKPGVVFKVSGVNVDGTLKAEGSADEPIVFTSLKDDAYGGDTNNDGLCNPADASSTAACPAPGDWSLLDFRPTSIGSTLKHTLIRYGASLICLLTCGSVHVNGTAVAIEDSVIENGKYLGVNLEHSASTTISSSIIRNHPGVFGLSLVASTVSLDGVVFSNNGIGIAADGTSGVILGPGRVMLSGNGTSTTPPTLIP